MSIPYGYKIENGKIQINPSQQQQIITFFERYIAGMSVADAGRDLPLSHSTLRLTLMRSLYLGTDYYPQMMPEELFNTAQAAMRERSKAGRRRRESRPIYSEFDYLPSKGDEDPVRTAYHSIVAATKTKNQNRNI